MRSGVALEALARRDESAFAEARRDVLRSFEEREAFLEDVAVADTVLVLDALARARGMPLEPLALGAAARTVTQVSDSKSDTGALRLASVLLGLELLRARSSRPGSR